MSAIQSFILASRLKLGWINSIIPPKTLAPMKTESKLNLPVRASGKARAAKAKKCTSLSAPSNAWCGSMGQSIASVSVVIIIRVNGMSRCLRIHRCICHAFQRQAWGLDRLKIQALQRSVDWEIAYRLYI